VGLMQCSQEQGTRIWKEPSMNFHLEPLKEPALLIEKVDGKLTFEHSVVKAQGNLGS
jgi:hypothetical protein